MTAVQTIPHPSALCTEADSPRRYISSTLYLGEEQTEPHPTDSHPGVTLSWIQSLSPELKDAALLRLCKTVEAKPTLVESFTLNQVLYRTISGGTFTESAESVAARTGCDRKTILKGLKQAVEQNILQPNFRRGTSTEYWFKPVSEWEPAPLRERLSPTAGNKLQVLDSPLVRNQGDRTIKIIELPLRQEDEQHNYEPVLNKDDHYEDTNIVFVSLKEEETTTEVSIPDVDTPKGQRWKYVGEGLPRVYMPPELDQDTGQKIESIHSATKEPHQFIIKNAVDLLYNRLNRIPSVAVDHKPAALTQIADVVTSPVVAPTIPEEVMHKLNLSEIYLTQAIADRLWLKYADKFEDALAYTVAQDKAGKIKQSKEGFFRKCLESGWILGQSSKQNEKQILTRSLTHEQQAWYEWACATGVCINVPIRDLPEKMGRIAVLIPIKDRRLFDPPHDVVVIDAAMRQYPMDWSQANNV